AAFLEAVSDRLLRESRVVLLPSEPLLLSGRNDLTVSEETRRAVVVESRDPQDVHHVSPCSRIVLFTAIVRDHGALAQAHRGSAGRGTGVRDGTARRDDRSGPPIGATRRRRRIPP